MYNHLRDALSQNIHEFPYNSFGKILLANGKNYPRNLGGNCVMQARDLVTKIRERIAGELDIAYLTATQRPHWVTVVKGKDGDKYLLDPFLMHTNPIEISKGAGARTVEYEANPKGINLVRVNPFPKDGDLQVDLLGKYPEWGKYERILRYTYENLDNTIGELPPDDYQLIANLSQKRLELGCLTITGNVIRIFCDPQTGALTSANVGKCRGDQRDGLRNFIEHLGEISDTVSVEPRVILQCMVQAREIYLKNKRD